MPVNGENQSAKTFESIVVNHVDNFGIWSKRFSGSRSKFFSLLPVSQIMKNADIKEMPDKRMKAKVRVCIFSSP